MNEEQPEASPDEEELQGEEPEFFDRALLLQPPEVRQDARSILSSVASLSIHDSWKRSKPFSKPFVLREKRS